MKKLSSIILGGFLLITILVLSTHTVLAAGPSFSKDNFHHPLNITNKYFPLRPETTFIYKGTEDNEPARDTFVVTERTKTILGVKTRVISDSAYVGGILVEKTEDWFAQDDAGNVWYFGESTTEYNPDGTVASHDGSWEAGVKGARPGIVMEAHPHVGDTYQQENAKGVAQDKATVLSLTKSICVPYRCFKNVLETKDFSPLQPGVVEHKYYAAGVGQIKTIMVQGGLEESHLTQVKTDN